MLLFFNLVHHYAKARSFDRVGGINRRGGLSIVEPDDEAIRKVLVFSNKQNYSRK